tara:strand:- start:8789 stop:9535 length:747 start_codon:yes stop_codon:yes gene_type:complete
MSLEQVIDKFLAEVQRLVDNYGEMEVEQAFATILPDFDVANPMATLGVGALEQPPAAEADQLMEVAPAAAVGALGSGGALGARAGASAFGGKLMNWLKNLFPKGRKGGKGSAAAGGAGVGTALGSAGLGAAALGASKSIDQDVNIADISTTDKLGVQLKRGDAPEIEQLLAQTNELIKQMTGLLSQSQPQLSRGIAELGTSIDDLISVETGEDVDSVQTRQNMRATAPRRSKDKDSKEKTGDSKDQKK